ncbi:MAG: DEAD/DEAH box helicase [Myxococcales bacterium]|nr:DEAD/DEAH box helicase [Myxococcales bacterium]
MSDPLAALSSSTREWFSKTFTAPSPVQLYGWPRLMAGDHALLLAPTGSGKTLAAFLASLDALLHAPADEQGGVRLLYVSPIKALAYDIEKNLQVPLAGIREASGHTLREIRIDVRTGDTSPSLRRKQLRNPGEILITTPESLYLLLGSKARETLRSVQTVIVDEIHALAGNKRGVHLSLSLERLDALCEDRVQRVGLSATQRPLERIAKFLGGYRDVAIVDCSTPPVLDLQVLMPKPVAPAPSTESESSPAKKPRNNEGGIWETILPRLLDMVQKNTTTLIFCNSRRLSERIALGLNDLAESDLCRAHHGSVARHQRKLIEAQLKAGELSALVSTSSLELGIDMSTVDLVVQIESPGSVASGLQRVGRAGHSLGVRSHGIIMPKFKGDLLESTVIGKCMLEGDVEETTIPLNCLDVVAQQIVAMCSLRSWKVSDLHALIRRSHCYADLSLSALSAVLSMLSGSYPGDELLELPARIVWDRQLDMVEGRRGAKMISLVNGGTIPDRGLFAVHLGVGGARIGELDEEMVYEARRGDTFFLGASTWRILDITRDQVIVAPAPGESGTMPFWHGEGPGRPAALGVKLGEFCDNFNQESSPENNSEFTRKWQADYKLGPEAAENLLGYLVEQREATGSLPSHRTIVIERFCDEVGDWRLCILSPYGRRVHAPWALAIGALLAARGLGDCQVQWTDDGIALRLPDTGRAPDLALLIPRSSEVVEQVVEQLSDSPLFATHFRENAARALLLPRQRPGRRTPLWLQRLKSQQLLGVAKRHASFPILIETYRECMQDVFDMPALKTLLEACEAGHVGIEPVETRAPSPFARSLVFSYIAAFLYEGDAPAAERRAQALTLDRSFLRELLGTEDLRDFLVPEALIDVEAELQYLASTRHARDESELHDMLRRLGALSRDALSERCTAPPAPWIEELFESGRACEIQIGGNVVLIACEDAGHYRDAIGVRLPPNIPEAFLAPEPAALLELTLRFASRRGPFSPSSLAEHVACSDEKAAETLRELYNRGRLDYGHMVPGSSNSHYCHPDVLRRIRRRSLEALRGAITPVSAARYTAFLWREQGLANPGHGISALREAIEKLAGLPLPFSDLEARILPARVADYRPDMLDTLCASGELLWMGAGALGTTDGKVRIVMRKHARLLLPSPEELPEGASPLAHRLDEELQSKGASFLVGLELQSDPDELRSAVAELVWLGRITNDTPAFLRGLKSRPRNSRAKMKVRMQSQAGRWSSTTGVVGDALSSERGITQRAHAQAEATLDCFGVVSRDLGGTILGSDAGAVLRLMEERGTLRRGYFVEAFQGNQYARPGTVDRLRDTGQEGPLGQLFSACDPANPWGAALPWPLGKGARRAGAWLLCWAGKPICYLHSGKLLTYRRDDSLDETLRALLPKLAEKHTLRISHIDGEIARHSELAERFLAHGFEREQKALVLEPWGRGN